MYPVIRLASEMARARNLPSPPAGETHVSRMRVWPWDIDVFMDLNNGRLLTLFDIGRFGLFTRMGILKQLKAHGWYGTVAGTCIRYRRRITVFQHLELRTRLAGWDDRFIYFEQAFWRDGECCAHAAIRTAITGGKGIVPPTEMIATLDHDPASPALPDWIEAWSTAETLRPWPPAF